MRAWPVRLLIAISAVGLTAHVAAQQAPARDASARTRGSGILRGRVVADDSDRPLPRARITLRPETDRRIDPVFTDADGRFILGELLPGRYAITVSKSGYVWGRLGARPIEGGIFFNLGDREAVDLPDVRLVKAAAISGRLVDELGDPVLAASVEVGTPQRINGELRFVALGRGITDDRGDFRIGGLRAGTYIVSVPGDAVGRMLSGAPEEWRRRGIGWSPIYYPAAADIASAQRITLKTGEEISSLDIMLTSSSSGGRLTVNATDVSGNPVDGSVRLISPGGAQTLRLQRGRARSSTLAPGNWAVEVTGQTGVAHARLTMGATDLEVSLVTRRAGRMSGRVIADDGRTDLKTLPLDIRFTSRATANTMAISPPIRVAADGTFEALNLLGRQEITLWNAPHGWALRSVTHQGRSLLDIPLDFAGGEELSDVEIRLTTEGREIAGQTVDETGQPVVSCFALVFPADPRAIQSGRLTRRITSDLNGRFALGSFPDGEYFVTATPALDAFEWSNPEFLSDLKAYATAVRLAGNEKIDLTLECRSRP